MTDDQLAAIDVSRDQFATFMMDHNDGRAGFERDATYWQMMLNPETAESSPDDG